MDDNSATAHAGKGRRPIKDLTAEERDQLSRFLEPIQTGIKKYLAVNSLAPDNFEPFYAATERALRNSAPLAPLLVQKQWVLWKWEIPEGKDKLTKVPYQARDPSKKARNNDNATWDTFDAAVSNISRADGIGFMLSEGLICAFDLDKCRDPATGAIADWAIQLLTECRSYAEVTPSGTGLRIIGYGRGSKVHQKFPIGDGSLEIYRRATRYITITSDMLDGYNLELVNIDEVIDRLSEPIRR